MKKYILSLLIICAVASLVSCNDMYDQDHPVIEVDTTARGSLYVLCEGLFNMNNSTLARIDRAKGTVNYEFFRSANRRGLGDTANDIALYGSKLYIVVNVSGTVEVVDTATGVSIAQIRFINEEEKSRQPRSIVFKDQYAYVSCFDGNVARIDTATLQIDALVKCGRNPDNLTIANSKIYVSNSGGLDHPFYDATVSVVDIPMFTEIKKIPVGQNPGSIVTSPDGDVYVVSRGDYGDDEYEFKKIDTEIDTVVRTFDRIHPLSLSMHANYIYMYSVDFSTKEYWIKVFDCNTDKVVKENFVTDGTPLQTPYGITASPETDEVFVCEAYNYVLWGDVLCFSTDGKLKYKIPEIGLNPSRVILLNQ